MGSFFSKDVFNPDTDIGNLSGKVIIVTGGNAGIGYATILHLARHGAKVYMAARNERKAKDAIERIKKELGGEGERGKVGDKGGEVIWLELDLSDPRKAKKSAESFLGRGERLDVLVNNAAILPSPCEKSKHDVQDSMMVNHIGPFVFTTTLLPLLKKTAQEEGSDVRIVNVSSDAIRFLSTGIRFRNKEDFNDEHKQALFPSMSRYGRSKLANVLFAKELQRRFDEENIPIIALSLHPGSVNTEGNLKGGEKYNAVLRALYNWISNTFMTPTTQGAYASVFAAAAPVVRAEPEMYKTSYLHPPGVIASATKDATNGELAKELWGTTVGLLKEIGVEVVE